MLDLTSSVKILALSPMKILLSRPFQLSGSMPPQKSISQPISGGILGTLWRDFPELSPLFRTGTTGSKSTSGISGKMEVEGNRSLYPRCWSHQEIYLRNNGTSGVQTPLSVISDYFEGEFFPYQSTPVWPCAGDQCDDIVCIIESHIAGDKTEELDTLYDPSGSKY